MLMSAWLRMMRMHSRQDSLMNLRRSRGHCALRTLFLITLSCGTALAQDSVDDIQDVDPALGTGELLSHLRIIDAERIEIQMESLSMAMGSYATAEAGDIEAANGALVAAWPDEVERAERAIELAGLVVDRVMPALSFAGGVPPTECPDGEIPDCLGVCSPEVSAALVPQTDLPGWAAAATEARRATVLAVAGEPSAEAYLLAMGLARATGHHRLAAQLAGPAAWGLLADGNASQALDVFREALPTYRMFGHHDAWAKAHAGISLAALSLGDLDVAADSAERSLRGGQRRRNSAIITLSWAFLGATRALQGRMAEATDASARSQAIQFDPAFSALVNILIEGVGDATSVHGKPVAIVEFRILRDVVLRRVPPQVLLVSPEGRGVTLPDGTLINLSRRGSSTRLVLLGLAAASQEGRRAAPAEVFGVGWPGEKIRWESARHRVYVAISTLRKLGLDPYLDSNDEGYRFTLPVKMCAQD
jgi:hypothetical protein